MKKVDNINGPQFLSLSGHVGPDGRNITELSMAVLISDGTGMPLNVGHIFIRVDPFVINPWEMQDACIAASKVLTKAAVNYKGARQH